MEKYPYSQNYFSVAVAEVRSKTCPISFSSMLMTSPVTMAASSKCRTEIKQKSSLTRFFSDCVFGL